MHFALSNDYAVHGYNCSVEWLSREMLIAIATLFIYYASIMPDA